VVFSYGRGNPIAVFDADAGSNPIQVTLTASAGRLKLSGTNGLVFEAGADGTKFMTVTGTLPDLNAALDGLRYDPPTGFVGTAWLLVEVDDLGISGLGKPL